MSKNAQNDDFPDLKENWEIESISNRLKQAVENADGNKAVSERAGVPLSTLNGYLAGRDMKASAAARLAIACNVSPSWLLLGHDADEPALKISPSQSHPIPVPANDVAYIDYYNVAASAGYGICADAGVKPEKVAVSLAFLKGDLGLDPNCALMLETSGDSMEPTLRSGDRLLVDTRRRHILDGVHVLVVNGGLLVKRLSSEPSGKICIASDNQLYKEFLTDASRFHWGEPDGGDAITIIGRVAYRLQAMS
ncbi:transcriptional regulator [Acetobacter cibinongensis]|uniref:Transcriptional regulator n=2 Tax=Acetobacter cibinongensis TaxID=146475 RepID=A0A0D6N327_9PROT|nr:transcriptional regulator phage repressor [Acetobacter cibinongensis]GBQ11740.1 S24 family peptidase [Acetobacter cibinongensis NRIC 0482]GEL60033.1 transcriptional regulator [Acetobacter cibinongensis]